MFTRSRNIRNFSLSNGLSRHRYFRPRRVRRRFSRPWYSHRRTRPTVGDLDSRFRNLQGEYLRRRETIGAGNDGSDSDEDENEQPEVPETDLAARLHVTNLDLNISENTKQHHTDMYECTEVRGQKEAELVVRRGQTFLITITFNRPYDIDKNDITLLFSLASDESNSSVNETIRVAEDKDTSYKPRRWGATIAKKGDNSLTVEVFSPASTPVGVWDLIVRTTVDVENGKDLVWQYNHNDDIIIIFNPWCKEDVVYLPDPQWLEEAVENDSGVLYQGTHDRMGGSSWYFGQFEDGILHAALHLVRKGFDYKMTRTMGKASKVARILSKIVNSSDDNGVLEGNWSDSFAGGTSPSTWTGSVKILKKYMSTRKPVKFGQCWVFSGVLVTVCRALGLPCRSVTNFESAHNSDKERLSCDEIFRPNSRGNYTNISDDSIWNFHVWNEVWMSRPDLGRKFDGWQVIDATPQETSDGVYCCGPTPVSAIKEGLLNIGQDTAFVFAEVNSDKVVWEEHVLTKKKKQVSRNPNSVGKMISTHEPTQEPLVGLQRLDLTDQYKYPEGSDREREVVRQAEAMFRKDNLEVDEEEPPVSEPLVLGINDIGDIIVGNGFDVKVNATNNGTAVRSVTLSVKVAYKTYYGVVTGTAAQSKYTEKLEPGKSCVFTLSVTPKQAMMRPRDGFNFHIEAVANVKETGNIVTETSSFRLRRPDLVIKGPSTAKPGETVEVELSFTNPLPVLMTNCEVEIDGNMKVVAPFTDNIKIGVISPGQTWRKTIKMSPTLFPRAQRKREASFGLESDQLGDVRGSYSIKLT
ncbi:protein-glutamine gamma-glutamyltransferase E-like isoform X1 [Haliotis rufescens]|uniref:protein-glutamine gamma-glutamyltransferase E-like isoform X1 n=1 Tax=Haliotis rufescens TaxID=6454 RepID=UPI00201F853C|nr:protein-glutamine gamma-glutamyltransferase E-like isoform X1 [Haliotis rufescens]XP_046364580.2 protein-glutamine gamma-glutamyltransferase E-like isoform X1 [Haliotis rufescens]